jgi:hypothetical protein
MLSGHRKLFNAERHRSMVDELKALGVPAVGFNQWWVPLVEFTAGGAVPSRRSRRARSSGSRDYGELRALSPKSPCA